MCLFFVVCFYSVFFMIVRNAPTNREVDFLPCRAFFSRVSWLACRSVYCRAGVWS